MAELPEGGSRPGQETGRQPGCICFSAATIPAGGSRGARADAQRCPLAGCCLTDPPCLGLTFTFSCNAEPLATLSWALHPRRGSKTLLAPWNRSHWLPNP